MNSMRNRQIPSPQRSSVEFSAYSCRICLCPRTAPAPGRHLQLPAQKSTPMTWWESPSTANRPHPHCPRRSDEPSASRCSETRSRPMASCRAVGASHRPSLKTEELLVDPFVTVTVASTMRSLHQRGRSRPHPVTFQPVEKTTSSKPSPRRRFGPRRRPEILVTGPASPGGDPLSPPHPGEIPDRDRRPAPISCSKAAKRSASLPWCPPKSSSSATSKP